VEGLLVKLHMIRMRKQRIDALFLIQVYFGSRFCPSALEVVGLRVPARYIRDFALFAPHVKIVPLLDVYQLLMLFAGMLTYSGPRTRAVNIFYNTFQLLSLLLLLVVVVIVVVVVVCIYMLIL
jgi:hypothetical protein